MRARLNELRISAAELHRQLVKIGVRQAGNPGKPVSRQTVYKWLTKPPRRVEQENVAALLDALKVPPAEQANWWRAAGYGTVVASPDETAA